MDIAVAGDVICINIYTKSEANGFLRVFIIVLRDEVNVEYARKWGLSIEVDDSSWLVVKEVSYIVTGILGFDCIGAHTRSYKLHNTYNVSYIPYHDSVQELFPVHLSQLDLQTIRMSGYLQ